ATAPIMRSLRIDVSFRWDIKLRCASTEDERSRQTRFKMPSTATELDLRHARPLPDKCPMSTHGAFRLVGHMLKPLVTSDRGKITNVIFALMESYVPPQLSFSPRRLVR
ncbi:MAG: hypothetical protein ACTHP8_01455, partial [Bosea sp. (in: a-proteobacteria)]|uniref:hypothetical protein n=1 Tax=Bosea sp. (in: a-proteobacteria) TaxID=1871050 RepID=UPI003F7C0214